MEKEIRKGADHTFNIRKFDQGMTLVPSSASFEVLKNGSSVYSGTASIDSETGRMACLVPAAYLSEVWANMRLDLTYVVSSVSLKDSFLFDVVLTPLENRCDDATLFIYLDILRDTVGAHKGKSSSIGTTNTLIDDGLRVHTDVDWTGAILQIFLPTGMREKRVTGFVKSTGTVSFEPAEADAVPSDIRFLMRDDYSTKIQEAFNEYVIREIRAKVGLAAGYIDGGALRRITAFKAISIICRSRIKEDKDRWSVLQKSFQDDYEGALTTFFEAYDRDKNGVISEDESAKPPVFSGFRMER